MTDWMNDYPESIEYPLTRCPSECPTFADVQCVEEAGHDGYHHCLTAIGEASW